MQKASDQWSSHLSNSMSSLDESVSQNEFARNRRRECRSVSKRLKQERSVVRGGSINTPQGIWRLLDNWHYELLALLATRWNHAELGPLAQTIARQLLFTSDHDLSREIDFRRAVRMLRNRRTVIDVSPAARSNYSELLSNIYVRFVVVQSPSMNTLLSSSARLIFPSGRRQLIRECSATRVDVRDELPYSVVLVSKFEGGTEYEVEATEIIPDMVSENEYSLRVVGKRGMIRITGHGVPLELPIGDFEETSFTVEVSVQWCPRASRSRESLRSIVNRFTRCRDFLDTLSRRRE